MLGSLNSEAAWCRHMVNKANITVIDVDYRMAPEYPFPTSIYDCWDAVKWVIANAKSLNIDPHSVSIGGLSAGGQMAAVLAHFARDEGIELKLHLMIVPATDMRYCLKDLELSRSNCPYKSVHLYHDVPWGPLGREKWFLKYWLGDDIGMLYHDRSVRSCADKLQKSKRKRSVIGFVLQYWHLRSRTCHLHTSSLRDST